MAVDPEGLATRATRSDDASMLRALLLLALTASLAIPSAAQDPATSTTHLVFGSCAREDRATARSWRAIRSVGPDALVLLGDTPYIDSTDLETQRRRYREFAAVPEFAALVAQTKLYSTWDDHDFGRNDTDGRIDNGNARKAFLEHRSHAGTGDGDRGIYTKFRMGPIEVFLLDTRTFAATEPSPFRRHAASLLGGAQWTWLRDGLEASTAPFKLLACGMIWNGATRPGKLDHWGSYPHERAALFRFVGEKNISGVFLVGGDIHRSRVVRHDEALELAGYAIHEFITSPLHGGVIESANAPHPGLVADFGAPNAFLQVLGTPAPEESAEPQLTVRIRQARADEPEVLTLWEREFTPPRRSNDKR